MRSAEWIQHLDSIQATFEALPDAMFSRRDIETAFQVGARRASQIMTEFGGVANGGIAREVLLAGIRKYRQSPKVADDAARRQRLSEKLAEAKARKFILPAAIVFSRFDSFPMGVVLTPGRVVVDYWSLEDFVRKLFSISQAMNAELGEIEKRFAPPPDPWFDRLCSKERPVEA